MKKRSIISTVLMAVAIIAVIYGMWQFMPKQKTVKYNQVVSYFEKAWSCRSGRCINGGGSAQRNFAAISYKLKWQLNL